MSPAPNQNIQSKIQYKNSSHKKYLLRKRNIFRLWNHRNFGRGKRKGSWLGRKTFGMLGTRSTPNIIYGKGRIGRNRNWIRSRCIRIVRGDTGQVAVILGTSNRNRNRVVRNRTGTEDEGRGWPPACPHSRAVLAQARVGTGAEQMTRFFRNSAVDRLARVPSTTDKTKHV